MLPVWRAAAQIREASDGGGPGADIRAAGAVAQTEVAVITDILPSDPGLWSTARGWEHYVTAVYYSFVKLYLRVLDTVQIPVASVGLFFRQTVPETQDPLLL